jgi:enoyl-[acyl-carrier protein] reductase III
MELKGKKALVSGGSRGVGRAVALRLAKAGCDLIVNYVRHAEAAEETVAAIEKLGRKAYAVKANVGNDEDVHRLIDAVAARFGGLDILVSNAASGVLKPALELTERHWRWTMDINAAAFLHLVRHAAPLLAKRKGTAIAISSLGAVRAIHNYGAVGASKAALESLARHLAVELAPQGIRINTISAGVIDTDALKHFPNRKELIDGYVEKCPLKRLTTPDDVADAVLLLCSPLAADIVGHTLVVDGGYSIVA